MRVLLPGSAGLRSHGLSRRRASSSRWPSRDASVLALLDRRRVRRRAADRVAARASRRLPARPSRSSAPRAGPPTNWRARSRGRVPPRSACRGSACRSWRSASRGPRLAGARHRAVEPLGVRGRGGACGLRICAARRAARVLADVADTPGFPRAAGANLGEVRLPGLASRRRRAPAARTRRAESIWRSSSHEAEQELGAAAVADRATLFTAARRARGGRAVAAHPLVLLDVEWRRRRRASSLRRSWRRACRRWPPATGADDDAARASGRPPAAVLEECRRAGGGRCRSIHGAPVLRGPPPQRASDGSVELFSAPGEGRECVEIARRILREAAAASPSTRWPSSCARPRTTRACSNMRSNAPACRPASSEGTRRPHPAAGRSWRCWRARPKGCRPTGSPSTCRWARCRRPTPVPVGAARRRGVRRRLHADPAPPAEPDSPLDWSARTSRRRRHLAHAAALGADAGRGRGDRRRSRAVAPAARGLRRGTAGAPRRVARGTIPRRRRRRRSSATAARLGTWRRSRCRSSTRWRRGRAQATWGEWLERFEQLAPRVLRAPGHVLRVLAICGRWRRWARSVLREVRQVLSERLRLVEVEPPGAPLRAACSSAARRRRGAGRSAWCSCPGMAERVFPQKARAGSAAARAMRAAARPRPRDEDGARAPASACCCISRSALPRAAVRLVSAPRRGGIARAGAVVLRARRGARRHRPHSRSRGAGRRRGAGRPVVAGLAGAAGRGRGHRRAGARPGGAARLARCAARRAGARAGAVPAAAEPGAAARRDRAMGASRAAKWTQYDGLVRVTDRTRDALADPAAGRRALLGVGAAAIRRLPLSVPARRDPPAARRRAARSRCSGWIR